MRGNGVSRAQAFRVWWFLFWAAGIGGLILAGLLALGVTFLFGAAYGIGTDSETASALIGSDAFRYVQAGLMYAIWLGWSLHVVRMAIRRQYKGFRIELIADRNNETA